MQPPKKSVKKAQVTKSDEAMDVDGKDGKAVEVNGEEPPKKGEGEKTATKEEVQKVNGEIEDEPIQEDVEQENILRKMASEVDKAGMTPLLRACCVYKTFEVRN